MRTVSRRSFLKHSALGLTIVSGGLSGIGLLNRLAFAAPNSGPAPEMTSAEFVEQEMQKGLHCSQVVVKRFAERRGWNTDELLAAAVQFSGGMGKNAPCGAVTGSYMVLGLHAHSLTEGVGPGNQMTYQKHAAFTEEYLRKNGTFVCGELLGHDFMTPEGAEAIAEQGLLFSICLPMVADTLDILERMIMAEEPG